MSTTENIEQAEVIVSDYGRLLSTIEPSIYGIPLSLLPYEKEIIKAAIQTLLLSIENKNDEINDGLTQAYVYLAQFIPDEDAKIAQQGRLILESDSLDTDIPQDDKPVANSNTETLELANQAVQTINGIKSEMENLMNEIRLLIP